MRWKPGTPDGEARYVVGQQGGEMESRAPGTAGVGVTAAVGVASAGHGPSAGHGADGPADGWTPVASDRRVKKEEG